MIEVEKQAALNGAMVCICIEPKLGSQLELIGGEPAERMHITLAYLGPAIELPFEAFDTIPEVLHEVSEQHPRLKAVVSGIGRFEGPEGEDAIVALVDAPGLEFLRNDIVRRLLERGLPVSQVHGFTPHITLAYVGFHEDVPRMRAGGLDFSIKSVELVLGEYTKASFKLRGTQKAAITAPALEGGGKLNPAHLDKTVVERDGQYCVIGESGKSFGCYPTKEQAQQRLRQVSSFSETRKDNYDVSWTIPVSKAEEERRLVYGVVLEPESVDLQNDVMDAEGIETTAHMFLSSFNRESELGLQHSILGDIGVELIESYIAPVDFQLGSAKVRKGSWILGVHVVDDKVWNDIKTGKITGFSVAGTALIAES